MYSLTFRFVLFVHHAPVLRQAIVFFLHYLFLLLASHYSIVIKCNVAGAQVIHIIPCFSDSFYWPFLAIYQWVSSKNGGLPLIAATSLDKQVGNTLLKQSVCCQNVKCSHNGWRFLARAIALHQSNCPTLSNHPTPLSCLKEHVLI